MSKPDIEIAAAVNQLFRRLPSLMGFSVQQVALARAFRRDHGRASRPPGRGARKRASS